MEHISMTREQQELLYEIACLHSDQFYLAMDDHWNQADFVRNRENTDQIEMLERRYIKLYGALPQWNYIDDVWETRDSLKKTLQND